MIGQSTRIYTGLVAAILLFSMISTMPHFASAATSGSAGSSTGIIISLYISPGSNTCGQFGGPGTTNCYDALIAVHNLHPNVPIVAKVNPSNGPGTAPDATHLNGFNKLKAAGITVLGYVSTGYARDPNKSIAISEGKIDAYKNWYNLDGIFFDEMSNNAADAPYYSTVSNYAKNVDGMKMTVCNPGTSIPQSDVGVCDTFEIYESAGLASISTLQSRTFYPNYDKHSFYMLAHTTNSIIQTDVTDRIPYVGYMYITNDVEPNPYDTIPPYFLNEVAYLDTGLPTPPPTPSTSPGSPTGLAATAISTSQINLSWTAPSGTVTGYEIERSTDGGSTWSAIVSNTATTSTTYSDTGLASATQYTYRVSAINTVGTSSPSNTNSATTSSTSTTPPPSPLPTTRRSPTRLAATAISTSLIDLSWTAPSGTISGYMIERAVGSGAFSTIVSNTATTSTTYSDSGAASATQYTYRVSAINSVGTSTPSNTASATTLTSTLPPTTPPTTLSLAVNSVDLSGSSFTGQWVQLNDSSGKTIATGFTPATFSVTSGTQYTVFAANFQNTVFNHWSDGNTNPSRAITPTQSTTLTAYYSTSSTTTPPPSPTPTSPGSPTGLAATAISTSQINLIWTAPSGTISGYKIERSTSGGTFSTIVSNTATTATTYSDTGLASATQYTYRVSAINGIGTSTPSSSASATTVLSSSPPTTSGVAALSGVSGFKSSLYLNPGTNGINWQPLIAAKQAHPRVPIIAMINPSSGPGTSYDSNFNAGINNLRAAGIIVLGYIGTKYCAMTLSTAEGQIDTYHSFYKLDGFLFDEMKNTSGCESYYSTLTNYAKSTYGDTLIIGNPGTSTIQSYVGTVDNIIIYESQGLPSISTLQSRTFGLAKSGFCFDAYGISTLDPTYAAQASQYVGCMQITDDSGSNPYDTLPSYLSSEIAALDTGSSSALPSILINPTTGPAGSTIAVSGNSFLSNSAVTVSYDSAAVTTNPGAITTDSSGSFTATFTEPAPSTGSHTVIAKDAASGLASAQFTVTSTTPPTTPPTTISLAVNSVDLSGNSFTGQWVQLNDSSGNTIATGFTPATFSVTSDSQYTVFAANFQNVVFNLWSDGNTNPSRAITPTQSTTLTAYYSTSSTTTPPPSPTSPSSPTGLTATTVSSSQINLSWTAPIVDGGSPVTGYEIDRSTDGGISWFTIVSNTATTATTYSDTGLASATQYTYRVSAINSAGTGSPSNTGSVTTLTPPPLPTPPGSPTGFTATTGSPSQIELSWTAPSGTISGYAIERSTFGGAFSTIVSNTATTSTTYSDTGLASATQYTYRVSAINGIGTGSSSNTGSATTL